MENEKDYNPFIWLPDYKSGRAEPSGCKPEIDQLGASPQAYSAHYRVTEKIISILFNPMNPGSDNLQSGIFFLC
jgi:hypothetical protein